VQQIDFEFYGQEGHPMLAAQTQPKLFVTECGVVLFTYLGLTKFKGDLYDAWQTAVELMDGQTVHGTVVRPPGVLPDLECADDLAQQLWEEDRAA
jgi:hypothetical protein